MNPAMKRLTHYFFCCLLLSFTCSVFAADSDQSYVIELRNQTPETIIPVLNPLLKEGDSVSGYNHELIIITSPERIQAIRDLVSQLDKPLRNLLISVKSNNNESSAEKNSGFSGGIRHEEVYVGTGEPVTKQKGLTIRSDGLAYSTSTTRHSSSTSAEHQVRAVEGSPAFIYTGESRQYPMRNARGEIESTAVDANKGFFVSARITGDRVLLDIYVTDDEFGHATNKGSQDTMSTRRLSTTISGRVGEWISLGGITLGDRNRDQSLAKKITTTSASVGDVSVRVNALDQ
jgi:type II secretory pathway component HofQ